MSKDLMEHVGRAAVDALFTAAGETDEQRLARALSDRLESNYLAAEVALVNRLAARGIGEKERGRYAASLKAHHDRVLDLLESPIERLVLPWLITMRVDRLRVDLLRTERPSADDFARPRDLRIVPQLTFGRHRLDFAVVLQMPERSLIVALECDGREFHRVPDDAARDRYLASFGIPTIRATGSDINGFPGHMALCVADLIGTWLDGKLRLAR